MAFRNVSIIEAVGRCRNDRTFLSQLRGIYRRADAAFAASGAVCLGGGSCCKFQMMRHEVHLSTGELTLLSELPPPSLERCYQGRCPYQIGPRCTAYSRRALGCRLFFCRESLQPSLQHSYELYHGRIRSAHQRHCLPYAYAELTASLVQLFAGA